MMRSIVGASMRFRLLVLAAAALTMAVGISQLRGAPVDVLPEFTPPYVEIQTEALGLSAEEVEQLITVPMEADLLNGVEGIDVLRSQSVPGMSSIVLVFEPDADLYRSRALVQERLAQVGAAAMPNVSKPPVMLQPYSSSSRVLMFGLSSEEVSPIEKSVIARWTIQPRLLGVPGVANVAIWGFRDRQLQVQVDPERLAESGVTLQQVVETTANAQISSPLSFVEGSTPGTGGFIETPQQRLGVRHVFDRLTNPEELGKVPVEGTGGRLRLADVTTVVEDHQPLIGDAVVNGADGLLLVVEKFPGANTLDVTRGVEEALADLAPGLGGMQPDTSVFRPATFIENAMDNLALASVIAGVLLALILAAFLFEWRTVLIGFITIPLSLVAAGLVLDMLGETFNALSFAGLAVAVAVTVDAAVAGAENVARRLRQERELGGDRSTADVVRDATHEVRSPLTYATFIALLTIVPVAVMAGRPGAFFAPLALAYVLAIGTAMVVAMTVTPALALLLFSRGSAAPRESPLLGRVGRRYGGALAGFMRRPRTALAAGGACLVAAVVLLAVLPLLGTSLIPSFKDRDMLVRLNAEPGTSNTRMTEIATEVSRELRSIEGVANVGAHVGRAITGDRIVDVNSADVWVSIDSDADYDATVAAIEDAIGEVPGARSDLVAYSEQQIRDVGALREGENPITGDGLDVLTGSERPLVVRVYGQNFDALRREAGKVQSLMSQVDGVVDARVEQPVEQPNVEIEVDLDRAQQFGIKPGDVRRAEATLVQGLLVGSVFEEQKVFEVVVQGTPAIRRSVDSIRDLLIDTPGGGHVRLGEVADVRTAEAPIAIRRDAVSRYLDVEADVSGRSLDAVADELEERLQGSVFPLEYHAEVVTQTTGEEINGSLMLGAALAVALAALLLMQAAFRSWRLAVLVLLSLPVALLGGAVAALVDGAELSLGAALGLLAVFGLAASNGVLLICHLQRLRMVEGEALTPELVERGVRERLTPILTTAVAVAVLALPFVVFGSKPGLEVMSPMALVILGGLVTSTFLALFLLPALYLHLGGREPTVFPEEQLLDRWDYELDPVTRELRARAPR
ncbi:MAG: efflux RND transporter permease subunit [Candidatus Limnocylindria bacterium]